MARLADPCLITQSLVVAVPVQQCWDIYTNNALLSEWAPAVDQVEYDTPTLAAGVIRKCIALVDKKPGHTVEQCTLCEPLKQIDINVTEETFGFSHMLANYRFSTLFNVEGSGTLLTMETHYQPKKIFASVMTSDKTQQQLLTLINDALIGFKHYAENSI